MKPIFTSTFLLLSLLVSHLIYAQNAQITGRVHSDGKGIEFATVAIPSLQIGTISDSLGQFSLSNIPLGNHVLKVSSIGYETYEKTISIKDQRTSEIQINLQSSDFSLNEVVVTGTMKEVSRMDSPVPVEIITPRLFQKNPTPSLF